MKECGIFRFTINNSSLSSEEALTIYRNKDVIEKNFDQLKNRMHYQRMRTHYTKTTDGKVFVAFLGLIMRSVFMKALKSHEETKSFSLTKAIRELEKIQQLQLKDGSVQTMPLTKNQKMILEALAIDSMPFK